MEWSVSHNGPMAAPEIEMEYEGGERRSAIKLQAVLCI